MTEVVTKCSLLSQMLLGSLTFCNENLKELMVNSSVASDFPGNSCSPLCCCRNNTHTKKLYFCNTCKEKFANITQRKQIHFSLQNKYFVALLFSSIVLLFLLGSTIPDKYLFGWQGTEVLVLTEKHQENQKCSSHWSVSSMELIKSNTCI